MIANLDWLFNRP